VTKQAERRQNTVNALLEAAQELFSRRGFQDTTVDAIVERAGVAKGALYHHFDSKEQVFAAVFERVQAVLAARVAKGAATGRDALSRLHLANKAFLEACLEPAVQRVILLDGPAQLGWERWRELDAGLFAAALSAGLRAAMDEGSLRRVPVEPLTHLLLGAATEAAMTCARAADPADCVRLQMEGLEALINGLRSS
jgi:AcrR family transcriptional regulator